MGGASAALIGGGELAVPCAGAGGDVGVALGEFGGGGLLAIDIERDGLIVAGPGDVVPGDDGAVDGVGARQADGAIGGALGRGEIEDDVAPGVGGDRPALVGGVFAVVGDAAAEEGFDGLVVPRLADRAQIVGGAEPEGAGEVARAGEETGEIVSAVGLEGRAGAEAFAVDAVGGGEPLDGAGDGAVLFGEGGLRRGGAVGAVAVRVERVVVLEVFAEGGAVDGGGGLLPAGGADEAAGFEGGAVGDGDGGGAEGVGVGDGEGAARQGDGAVAGVGLGEEEGAERAGVDGVVAREDGGQGVVHLGGGRVAQDDARVFEREAQGAAAVGGEGVGAGLEGGAAEAGGDGGFARAEGAGVGAGAVAEGEGGAAGDGEVEVLVPDGDHGRGEAAAGEGEGGGHGGVVGGVDEEAAVGAVAELDVAAGHGDGHRVGAVVLVGPEAVDVGAPGVAGLDEQVGREDEVGDVGAGEGEVLEGPGHVGVVGGVVVVGEGDGVVAAEGAAGGRVDGQRGGVGVEVGGDARVGAEGEGGARGDEVGLAGVVEGAIEAAEGLGGGVAHAGAGERDGEVAQEGGIEGVEGRAAAKGAEGEGAAAPADDAVGLEAGGKGERYVAVLGDDDGEAVAGTVLPKGGLAVVADKRDGREVEGGLVIVRPVEGVGGGLGGGDGLGGLDDLDRGEAGVGAGVGEGGEGDDDGGVGEHVGDERVVAQADGVGGSGPVGGAPGVVGGDVDGQVAMGVAGLVGADVAADVPLGVHAVGHAGDGDGGVGRALEVVGEDEGQAVAREGHVGHAQGLGGRVVQPHAEHGDGRLGVGIGERGVGDDLGGLVGGGRAHRLAGGHAADVGEGQVGADEGAAQVVPGADGHAVDAGGGGRRGERRAALGEVHGDGAGAAVVAGHQVDAVGRILNGDGEAGGRLVVAEVYGELVRGGGAGDAGAHQAEAGWHVADGAADEAVHLAGPGREVEVEGRADGKAQAVDEGVEAGAGGLDDGAQTAEGAVRQIDAALGEDERGVGDAAGEVDVGVGVGDDLGEGVAVGADGEVALALDLGALEGGVEAGAG